MGLLDDIAALDAAFFCDPDLMPGAEAIVYRPAGRLGSDVTVNAQVFRQGIKPILGVTGIAAPSLQVWVSRADVPNPQPADVFLIPTNVGGAAVAHPFGRRVSEDSAGFLLELR
jgi:hypothetical protein